MRFTVKGHRGKWFLRAAVVAGGCLVFAPMAARAGENAGQRAYYFSRTSQPYESYETWLQSNPRQSHPYHDTVHGPLFSDANSKDPAVQEAKTKPIRDQPAFRAEAIKPPYGWNRILWVNDRYYSGKYYPTAKQAETPAAEGAEAAK